MHNVDDWLRLVLKLNQYHEQKPEHSIFVIIISLFYQAFILINERKVLKRVLVSLLSDPAELLLAEVNE